LLNCAAEALTDIKRADGLTWADLGIAIGRSDDQAAKYADASATMDFVTFIRCCTIWRGRFANSVFGLVDMHLSDNAMPTKGSDIRRGIISLMELMTALEMALLNDGQLHDSDVVAADRLIEEAGRLVDMLRHRVADVRSNMIRAV
jgi:hypothetical protein